MKLAVKDVIGVYGSLDAAHMGKMSGKAQVKLVKIVRKLKGLVTPFVEAEKDAREKLKGEDHAKMEEMAKKWNEEGRDCTLTVEDRKKVLAYFDEYKKNVDESLKDELEKEYDVELEKLTEEEFECLLESNEFTVNQIIAIEDLIKTV